MRERKRCEWERVYMWSYSFGGGFDSHLFIQRKSFVGNAYITMNILQIHAFAQMRARNAKLLTFRNFIGKQTEFSYGSRNTV